MCRAIGLKSISTVYSHLNKFENLGYIRWDATKPRYIEVTEKDSDYSEGMS